MSQPVPAIAPVPAGPVPRPDWSVVIPTHNCAGYLRTCLESVLAQAPAAGSMEILVVDDLSDDRPEDVVAEVGGGRVAFHRHAHRHGAVANFTACLELARGEVVHLLHGDDLVLPGFYTRADAVLAEHPDVGAFVSRATYVDEHGVAAETTRSEVAGSGLWRDALDVLTVSNRVRPPAIAVRRRVYEAVGGFRPDLPHAADWEMWVRVAAATPVWFEDAALAGYRRHGASDTATRVQSGANMRERFACIEVNLARLSPHLRRRQARRAYAYSAAFATRTALRLARRGALRGAATQLGTAGESIWRAARA